MDSSLFQVLPNDVIQQLFGTLETVDVETETALLHQGSLGDYFYVVERGFLEVTRAAGESRQAIHVADLRPGDTFGEAALISGKARDSSVTALTPGRLLRLPKANFETLIAARLLRSIGAQEALEARFNGAHWLDIGDPEVYAKAPLRNSRNIPLNALREQSSRLPSGETYIVCSDDPALNAVGAYILAERGFDVLYLREPVVMLIAADARSAPTLGTPRDNVVVFPRAEPVSLPPANPEVDVMNTQPPTTTSSTIERVDRLYTQQEFEAALAVKVPKETYAETQVGQSLAALIDDIDARKEVFEPAPAEVGIETIQPDFIDLREFEARAPAPTAPAVVSSTIDFDLSQNLTLDEGLATAPVTDLVHDFERRVRNYIEAQLIERSLDTERRYRERVQRLQESAQAALRKRDHELKQRYSAHYGKKERVLRENYQKLVTLANKISHQKAQLQQARKQMEEKLKAANVIQQQVEDMRRLLGEQMGAFDLGPSKAPARASNA